MEVLAYIGAAVMVILAVWAYRYWKATPTYARLAREAHARQTRESSLSPDPATPEPMETPRPPSGGDAADPTDSLNEVERKLADLPTGIELLNLPAAERNQVADQRRELEHEKARLLAKPNRGHRRAPNWRSTRPPGIENQ